MKPPFQSYDPDEEEEKEKEKEKEAISSASQIRLRDIPLKNIFPNLLTLLAICSGLTSIRFGIEGKTEWAVAAIIFAGFLDGIDGRVARFLKSSSKFGAEMDSLADFVNFGVAPALLLYFTILYDAKSLGWIAVLIYASCACLRLARFNVMSESPQQNEWYNRFFIGVPAPAGAMIALLPVYLQLLDLGISSPYSAYFTTFYTLICGYLMVSNLPTFSGKTIGNVRHDYVLPFMILAVFLVAAMISFPWIMLSFMAITYLATLPISYWTYYKNQPKV